MPILLYGVGAVAFVIGVAAIGFGIPNNEFGIGNTLIVAGMTAATGGLIVLALGVVVTQLQRIADTLGNRAPVRTSRPFETFEQAAPTAPAQPQAGPARVAFPPRPKAEPKQDFKQDFRPESRPEQRPEPRADYRLDAAPEAGARDPFAPEPRMDAPGAPFRDRTSEYYAPSLSNPDEPPVTVADEVYLSPLHPAAPPAPAFFRTLDTNANRRPADTSAERRPGDTSADRDEHFAPPPSTRPPNTYFDSMWPAEPKSQEPKSPEQRVPEARPNEPKQPVQKSAELQWPDAKRSEQLPGKARTPKKPAAADDTREAASERGHDDHAEPAEHDAGAHAVAILKSGVVDGMGYTLYVDGSIEAELPQGTLRFASINELRGHLEKTM